MKKPLLILPFDHRNSFKKLLEHPTPEEITHLKTLVFEGFLKTFKKYQHDEYFGILVDEQYGSEIIKRANELQIQTAVPVEASGLELFEFEYGEEFGEHIENLNPTFAKVLVRYNPAPQKKDKNQDQLAKLKKLSDYCKDTNRKLLFELLVPPTQTERMNPNYETEVRPENTAQALREINKCVDVTIWKLEGTTEEGWNLILPEIDREEGVIVLGRGEDRGQVQTWLKTASKFDQVIGFAIGRTIFAEPLEKYITQEASEEETINTISKNFKDFVDLWYEAKGLKALL